MICNARNPAAGRFAPCVLESGHEGGHRTREGVTWHCEHELVKVTVKVKRADAVRTFLALATLPPFPAQICKHCGWVAPRREPSS